MRRPTKQLTISVPEAGARLGIGRNAAYEAARLGQIPTIKIGKRLLVSIAALEAMLAPRPRDRAEVA